MVQKAHVERGIVNYQLRTADKLQEFRFYLLEPGFVCEKIRGEPMHFNCGCINVTLRVQIAMKVFTGEASILDFDTTDLNDPVSLLRVQPCGFGVEYYLSHIVFRSILRLYHQLINALVGKLVSQLVFRVPAVTLYPVPLNLVFANQRIELLP